MVTVSARGISKNFGDTSVLRDVHLTVPDGKFGVLVGPSGCGKSTFLRILAGLEQVDHGVVEFGERDVTRLEPRDRSIAMVFQSYALYPHMTVRENLEFGLKLRKVDAATRGRRVAEAARMLAIEHLLDRHPRALSGGQRQRVAMGRAIVRRPQLFLFDEPLSNLDPTLRSQVRVDIRRQHQELGATSIYVTHDQVEAMTLADVLYVLDGGMVRQSGSPKQIYRRPENTFVATFLGSPAMNLVRGRLARLGTEWVARFDGQDRAVPIRWPEGAGPEFEEALEVRVGIRPHDVKRCSLAQAELVLGVEVVEMLGPEATVHGRLLGTNVPFVATLPPCDLPKPGDQLPFRVDEVHLFDALTEQTLRC